MDPIDLFLQKFSYKFPKGYPDMNNEQDVLLLESILDEIGINLDEAKPQTFEDFIKSKDISVERKTEVLKSLSTNQKALILKNASNNISKIISFLNSNQDISRILTNIKDTSTGEANMGPGEVAMIVCSLNGKKISGKAGDVEIKGKRYELKGGKRIKAGGTYQQSIERLTTTLWNLKQIFEGENAEKYKQILGSEIFNEWGGLKGSKKDKEISFTDIGSSKLTKVRSIFEKLRNKIKQIADEDTTKPNIISVGSKDFEISKDELNKIADAEPGKKLTLAGKVVLSQESEKILNKIRQDLKVLLTSNILTIDENNLSDAIKHEFISKYDGLINVIDTTYTLYSQEEFIEKWDFAGLTQGNRPLFVIKGTKLTEDQDDE